MTKIEIRNCLGPQNFSFPEKEFFLVTEKVEKHVPNVFPTDLERFCVFIFFPIPSILRSDFIFSFAFFFLRTFSILNFLWCATDLKELELCQKCRKYGFSNKIAKVLPKKIF